MVEMWDKEKVYVVKQPSDGQKKIYTLSMFPYPSGSGLHVGHVRIYTGTDILARYFRMKGYSVLHPMGWDAFGLPAENAAIKAKKNPIDIVPQNIANFKSQMRALGLSYDWSREFATTDFEYYKWTQWLFLKLYSIKNKKGERLVYRTHAPIAWCPSCKTGLANEEVLPDGTHERCGSKTEEKLLPQWMMRITDFADRLLDDLDKDLDWPKGILEMQRNWIGRREGMIIHHKVEGMDYILDTFTAFPAWSYADTYIVIAPEHPFVGKVKNEEIKKYLEEVKKETREDRMAVDKEKTGVFTGYYAQDSFRPGEKMPIWIANFALMDFGTGAIRCSAHDERDVEFAKKYGIALREVVKSEDRNPVSAHKNKGMLVDSGPFTGKEVGTIIDEFIKWSEEKNIGEIHTTYHLRDWIFSRQRYWGEPFPLVYCDKCGDENGVVPIPEDQLPVKLPYVESYEPTETGESTLSLIKDWVNTTCPKCGGTARRETDTMPNWAGSCWYFLYFARNLTPEVEEGRDLLAGRQETSGVNNKQWNDLTMGNWLPVDWYLGGAEHAVLHLLYARFWVKAFYDLGLVDFTEPFRKLRNVGMVLAEDNRKMSKSLGNVINPDDMIKEFGADTLRVYEAFMAPFSQEVAWSTRAVQGSYRFLTRIWQIYHNSDNITKESKQEDRQLVAKLQSTILKITSDITNVKFNTSIAAMMEFLNEWEKADKKLYTENAKVFLKLLAPFAPFITEQIWREVFDEKQSIHVSNWPLADQSAIKSGMVTIPVQVNGKVRSILRLSQDETDKDTIVKKALQDDKVAKYVSGTKYRAIYVPGKILNLVLELK